MHRLHGRPRGRVLVDAAKGGAVECPQPRPSSQRRSIVMLYSGLNVLRQGRAVVCVVDAPAPDGTGETFVGPVTGEILLTPVGRTVLARGHLTATATLACARCLTQHDAKLEITVDRECSLAQVDDPKAFIEPEDDLPPVPILNGDEIDLGELVRQLLIIALPPRSLCREGCKGLCPQCGADLNQGACQCQAEEIDPRLAPLKALLEES